MASKHLYWIVPVALVALVVLGFLIRNLIQNREWKNIELMEDGDTSKGSMADDVKRAKRKVIYFFADWCGHCRNLSPIWDDFAEKAKAEGVDVFKVNVDKEKALAEANGVQALPDIRFITETSEERYNGERTLEGLTEALQKMTASSASSSKSKDD